jgi:hypothetical protein
MVETGYFYHTAVRLCVPKRKDVSEGSLSKNSFDSVGVDADHIERSAHSLISWVDDCRGAHHVPTTFPPRSGEPTNRVLMNLVAPVISVELVFPVLTQWLRRQATC